MVGMLMSLPSVSVAQQPPPQWIEIPAPDGSYRDQSGSGYRSEVVLVTIGAG